MITASAEPTTASGRILRRMLAAFSYRDFRVLWFGSCTSSVGTWMQNVAENWLVLSLTGSALFLGLDAFLQQLPIILFMLIGGVLADRFDRRRTLIVSQYIQMSCAFTLAILVFSGHVHVWQILTLSFITGSAQAFGGPASQALVPSLVDKSVLPNAIALNSIQFNLARHWTTARRRCLSRVWNGLVFFYEWAFLPRRDRGVDVAACEAHPAIRTQAAAR